MGTVISADGTEIVYKRAGSGPPVILLSGGPGDSSGEQPLAEVLRPFFTVFTYDRRGRGQSGDTKPYSVERDYEDLAAVIAEAGGSAGVYGSSGMGMIGLEAAAHGVPVSRLAMWEPPYIVEGARRAVPADWGDRVAELIAAGRSEDAIQYWLVEIVNVPVEYVTSMRGTPFWAGMAASAHALVYDAAILRDFSVPARAASVSVPTLVMDGGDAALPWIRQGVQEVLRILPAGRHHVLLDQAHDVPPEIIAPVLIKFFEE
ncbi:pimeloyl-ACP methyl ester carboxylesterase [Kibdelosporangium banguiense]|uniref:Pimeloyl-ACP methyl ester carboxylesterase n=1 Tax=Kibdelosporangium banguiense TaxID=1365924 RepID=A0ABS4TLI4_9PSEU|nr:alpha/beta hydrolase [Kibdelosporangium banguiense]MBP2325251.1 pimeloyl-ACP methyl ester carboxylesterase [Kibdelosporangium banguiense]